MASGGARRAYLKLQLVLREVVALSPRTMRAIVANSLRMTARDARRLRQRHTGVMTDGGRYTGAVAVDGGTALAVTFERATLHVRALDDEVVRLAWGPAPVPYDVVTRDQSFVPGAARVDVTPDAATLTTPRLSVRVQDDRVVVADAAGAVRYVERTPLVAGPRRVLRRDLRPGERLCGLGEQTRGLDLTGSTYRLWNRDPGGAWGHGQTPLYCSMPVTVGLHASGPVWAFHENTHEAHVTVGRVAHGDHGVEATFEGGACVTYVAVGELDQILTAATRVVGAPSLAPRWALGYHHCRWGWRSDDAVESVLDGFAARSVPISAVHLDIDHMDAYRVFTFDPRRFARIDELVARAARAGTRVVTIVDPAVRRDDGFALYHDGVAGGHFVTEASGRVDHGTVWPGWAAFPDFSRAATRAWWGSQYAALVNRGIAGVWHDMNEPTSITLWGDRTLPRDDRFDLDGRGGDHAEAHGVYGLLMNMAGFEALEQLAPDRRPFVLSRAGFAGLARYAWQWTADVEASVEGLAQQVPTFLGLGLSGVAFTGSDIGGFSGIPTPGLYLRWMELGVVSPFCRTHCILGAPDREPWTFPAPYDAAIERLVRLRYRLLPHLYRLAEEAHRLGHPLWRPADWPIDAVPSGASAATDCVLLGEELAIVPVADPATDRVTVVLPPGTWRRLRLCDPLQGERGTESVQVGGAAVTLDAPLGQPIILQREGTVVVLDDRWDGAGAALDASHAALDWSLHVACDVAGGAVGEGYDDAGDGAGEHRRDRYVATTRDGRLELVWTSEGAYARDGAVRVVLHGSSATTAEVDGDTVQLERDGDLAVARLEGPFGRFVAS